MLTSFLHLASVSGFLAVQAMALVSLALTSYILGRTLTHRLSYPSLPTEIAIATTLGLGSYATLLFALGLVGALDRPWVVALVVAIHLLGHRAWRRLYGGARGIEWRKLASPLTLAACLAASAFGLMAIVFALYPPTGFDATLYHLPQASRFVASHGVPYSPELRYPVFPHLLHVLFAQVMMFWSDAAAGLVHALCMLMVGLGLYAWGAQLYSRRIGVIAAFLWAGNPAVLVFGVQAYVDQGLALFAIMACFALVQWAQTRQAVWLALSGAFCGFAAATKYHGLFFLLVLGAAAGAACVKQRRYRTAALLVLTALVLAAPWYGRIYRHTGNPVFPFQVAIFGHSQWSTKLAWVPYGDPADTPVMQPVYSGLGMAQRLAVRADHVLSTSLVRVLRLPWDLVYGLERFRGGKIPFSPAYLLLSPLVIFAVVRRKELRPILALVVLYALFWVETARDTRYLVSAISLLSLIAAAGVGQALVPVERASRRVASALLFVICGLALLPAARFALPALAWRGLPPITEEARRAYLRRSLPLTYQAIEYLNENFGDDYRVYALNEAQLTHFADGVLLGDWFGPYRFPRISPWVHIRRLKSVDAPSAVDSRGFYDTLRAMDVGFYLAPRCNKGFKFPLDDFFRRNFTLVYSNKQTNSEVCVWQLAPQP